MRYDHYTLSNSATVTFGPDFINPSWIIEGSPRTRKYLLSTSADGNANSYFWDCTAGRFVWFYSIDETAHVLQGSALLKDYDGTWRPITVGDTIFFPAGTKVEWIVDEYVRKIAFCRSPLPRPVMVLKGIYRLIKRLRGKQTDIEGSRAMTRSGS